VRALVQDCGKAWLVDTFDNNWAAFSLDIAYSSENFIKSHCRHKERKAELDDVMGFHIPFISDFISPTELKLSLELPKYLCKLNI
jgi:hypothetical protein